MSCATPKFGDKIRHSAPGNQIDSRVVGVEVICGKFETVFLYVTDNMISSGGNIMVEIIRQGQYNYAATSSVPYLRARLGIVTGLRSHVVRVEPSNDQA